MGAHRARRLATAGVVALAFVLGAAATADASFTRSRSATRSVSVATLQPPTNVAVSNVNCHILGSTDVQVSWTASTSTFVGGYQVSRAATSNGTYTVVGTITGTPPTTTFVDQAVSHSTTLWYKVKATKPSWSWTSIDTTPKSVITLTTLCVL